MRSPRDYGWNPIESARHPVHTSMAISANSGGLDQREEGNTARGHASEVEAIPRPAVSPTMTVGLGRFS
jgi:hypothetical protein